MENEKLPDDEIGIGSIELEDSLEGKAKDLLRGNIRLSAEAIVGLSRQLRNYKSFSYARRILELAALDQDQELDRKLYQQWALCTYKDDDLPVDQSLNEALRILALIESIDTTSDQETLGLVGAIHKNKWKVDNQKVNLERSLSYYVRGYEQGPENDQGYTGINAAFVLDWLAFIEEKEAEKAGTESIIARERREKAREIRRDIIEKVTPLVNFLDTFWLRDTWWYYSTLAEAYFGLRDYEQAARTLLQGKEVIEEVPEWEEESTVQQLARLAMLHSRPDLAGEEYEGSPAWDALTLVFGARPGAVRTAFTGKIGLALSGGGFRASLFHIGTLARLAELDVLRHVEVLSCVSGGSIIGAFYYLKVKKLLESNDSPTKQDYIEIVKETVGEFIKGVQENIRVRVAAELTTNIKMAFYRNYSRTMRAGELFEKELFFRTRTQDGKSHVRLPLRRLKIIPKGETAKFNPKLHNWRRTAKVPVLILNATTLNTGHIWQFTTTWMGEPPSSVTTKVDTNDRLRRMYHDEAPVMHREISLGTAVAASASVPGLFDPVIFNGLYPDRIIGLVDGGVCDNQGITSLLEQDCTVILVSDGSGQMASQMKTSTGVIRVPLRSNSILQARIRDTQYQDLEKRKRSSLLRGLMFIHLKRDLDGEEIDWIDCKDPVMKSTSGILTDYGISRDIQQKLAEIRTDLDSFSDVEAYALMTSAYRMTEKSFQDPNNVDGFTDGGDRPVDWEFLKVEPGMRGSGEEHKRLNRLLSVSDRLAFKVWKLVPTLAYSAIIIGLAILLFLTWLVYQSFGSILIPPVTVGAFALFSFLTAVILLSNYELIGTKDRIAPIRSAIGRIVFWLGMCIFGCLALKVHLWTFDKLFIYWGSLARFQKAKKS